MALDTDQLALLQAAVMTDQDLSSIGLRQTEEVKAAYEELKEEYSNAPEGTMVEIISDIDFGKYDSFEANNERFYGKLY